MHQLRKQLSLRYDLVESEINVDGDSFKMLRVRDTNLLLENIDPQEFNIEERLPYWAEIWLSSIELASFCLHTQLIKGKSVLEIGCGLGLAGIAVARGGGNVIMTDYEHDALEFARYNALRNLSTEEYSTHIVIRELDWKVVPNDIETDFVIASDVVYERRNFAYILALLQRVLRPNGRAIFTDPDRAIAQEFVRAARDAGFRVVSSLHSVTMEEKHSTIARHELQRISSLSAT